MAPLPLARPSVNGHVQLADLIGHRQPSLSSPRTVGRRRAAISPVQVTVCSIWIESGMFAQHMHHAVQYYSGRYPHVRFTRKLVGRWHERFGSTHGLAESLVDADEGGECDVILGPGVSQMAESVSVLIHGLWVDPTASSTKLSDEKLYPFFSRVIPTDAALTAGVVEASRSFGWTTISTLCSHFSYGRSVVDGFVKEWTTPRPDHPAGRIGISRCVPDYPTVEELALALQSFEASGSRIVFVGVRRSALVVLQRVFAAEDWGSRLQFVFSDFVCSGDVDFGVFRGGLCMTYMMDETRLEGFRRSFVARPAADVDELYAWASPRFNVGGNTFVRRDNMNHSAILGIFGADAALFAMNAVAHMAEHNSSNFVWPLRDGDVDKVVAEARRLSVEGITGPLALEANGDRPATNMALINSNHEGKPVVVANRLVGKPIVFTRDVYWMLGTGYSETAPVDTPPSPPAAPSQARLYLVMAIVVGGVILVATLITIAAVLYIRRRLAVSRCPKDPAHPFTVLFVNVKNEVYLRDRYPHGAGEALEIIESIVRDAARRSDCYVARRLDSTAMVVATTPLRAINCAADLQRCFSSQPWAHLFRRGLDTEKEKIDGTKPATRRLRQRKLMFAGEGNEDFTNDTQIAGTKHRSPRHAASSGGVHAPRTANVRPQLSLGMAVGIGRITFESETNSYSYAGDPVERAAAITDLAAPTQVLMTSKVWTTAWCDDEPGAPGASAVHFCRANLTTRGGREGAVSLMQLNVDGAPLVSVDRPQWALDGPQYGDDSASLSERSDMSSPRDAACLTAARRSRMFSAMHATASSVTAALESARSGLAPRGVAILYMRIPALRNPSGEWSLAEHASRVTQAHQCIAGAARTHRAVLLAFFDGEIVIAISAAEVSFAPTRAVLLALRLVDRLQAIAESEAVHCGVSFAAALCGHLGDERHTAVLGTAVKAARFLSGMARNYPGVQVLTTSALVSDEAAAFDVQSVDVGAWPHGVGDPGEVLLHLVAVLGCTSDASWLYVEEDGEMAQAERFIAGNHGFNLLLSAETVAGAVALAQPASASAARVDLSQRSSAGVRQLLAVHEFVAAAVSRSPGVPLDSAPLLPLLRRYALKRCKQLAVDGAKARFAYDKPPQTTGGAADGLHGGVTGASESADPPCVVAVDSTTTAVAKIGAADGPGPSCGSLLFPPALPSGVGSPDVDCAVAIPLDPPPAAFRNPVRAPSTVTTGTPSQRGSLPSSDQESHREAHRISATSALQLAPGGGPGGRAAEWLPRFHATANPTANGQLPSRTPVPIPGNESVEFCSVTGSPSPR